MLMAVCGVALRHTNAHKCITKWKLRRNPLASSAPRRRCATALRSKPSAPKPSWCIASSGCCSMAPESSCIATINNTMKGSSSYVTPCTLCFSQCCCSACAVKSHTPGELDTFFIALCVSTLERFDTLSTAVVAAATAAAVCSCEPNPRCNSHFRQRRFCCNRW